MAESWKRLADEIHSLMGRRRLSTVALGRQIGMGRTTLYGRLTGKRNWTHDELRRVAEVLEVDLDELLRLAGIDPATAWEVSVTRVEKLARNGKTP